MKILRIFSATSGHPEGRGRATPIFSEKLNLGIFSKFLRHSVGRCPIYREILHYI